MDRNPALGKILAILKPGSSVCSTAIGKSGFPPSNAPFVLKLDRSALRSFQRAASAYRDQNVGEAFFPGKFCDLDTGRWGR
jgi:hypothetical protein